MAEIDDIINNYLTQLSKLENKDSEIEELRKANEVRKEELKKQKQEIKEALRSEKINSNPFVSYCFLNYEENVFERIPILKNFTSNLERNVGEKILIFESGGKGSSTAIGSGESTISPGIRLAKIKSPGYNLSKSNLNAVVEAPMQFDSRNGWTKCARMFLLDEFFDNYCMPSRRGFIAKDTNKGGKDQIYRPTDYNLKGFDVIIPVPIKLIPETTFGGSRTYDSNIIAKLIVGDRRVEKYIKNLDLTVYSGSRKEAPI